MGEAAGLYKQIFDVSDVFELNEESTGEQIASSVESFSDTVLEGLESLPVSQCGILAEMMRSEFSAYRMFQKLRDSAARLRERCAKFTNKTQREFEWVDSRLIGAIQRGTWMILQDVDSCQPSVVDRINSLIEPDGALVCIESGTPRTIKPHPSFRIICTAKPTEARSVGVSAPFRNRCLEVYCEPRRPPLSSRPDIEEGGYFLARLLADIKVALNEYTDAGQDIWTTIGEDWAGASPLEDAQLFNTFCIGLRVIHMNSGHGNIQDQDSGSIHMALAHSVFIEVAQRLGDLNDVSPEFALLANRIAKFNTLPLRRWASDMATHSWNETRLKSFGLLHYMIPDSRWRGTIDEARLERAVRSVACCFRCVLDTTKLFLEKTDESVRVLINSARLKSATFGPSALNADDVAFFSSCSDETASLYSSRFLLERAPVSKVEEVADVLTAGKVATLDDDLCRRMFRACVNSVAAAEGA
eukprot:GHVO01010787.1.p1 GENE.GHVO01010787.1~~GHVO01010787.1.p1  ORF type:complete len:490 (+),score=53.63 GHVO01010787.1:57-1472(+)